jgi:hypothetical protein
MNITIHIHRTADCLPDADTDVLVLAEGDTEMQLGAARKRWRTHEK